MRAMSTDPHATDLPDHAAAGAGDHHAADDHGDSHGHDDHGHGEEALGPIDTVAWLAGGLGVVARAWPSRSASSCATASAGAVPPDRRSPAPRPGRARPRGA